MEKEELKRVARESYRGRMQEIRSLRRLAEKDPEAYNDFGRWDEYGLSLDYVPAGTFNDQRRGYLRFQISWGGPSEEFRFFMDERLNCTSIEFWYLDWGCGHRIKVSNQTMRDIFEEWSDCDMIEYLIDKAEAA